MGGYPEYPPRPRTGYPPDLGRGAPPDLEWGTPLDLNQKPPPNLGPDTPPDLGPGTPPTPGTQRVPATWRAVCLLRSRRRTFLFILELDFPPGHFPQKLKIHCAEIVLNDQKLSFL